MKKTKIWNAKKKKEVDAPQKVTDFLNEIEKVCKKHGLSISHEDTHGSFIITTFHATNIEGLKNAMLNI